MSNARFIIIEDDVADIQKYRKYLGLRGVTADDIWPKKHQATANRNAKWINVKAMLDDLQNQGWNPTSSPIVLLIDLALNEDGNPHDGVDELLASKEFLADYICVVISHSADSARATLAGIYDYILPKRELTSTGAGDNSNFFVHRFWSAIRSGCASWSRRTGRDSGLLMAPKADVHGDAIGLKVFEARFGASALGEISQYLIDSHEAVTPPSIAVANGGYSGAAVLLIDCATKNGLRSIALKLSEDEEALARERAAAQQATEASGKFSYAFHAVQGPSPVPASGKTLYFLEQVFLHGKTLEDVVLDGSAEEFKLVKSALQTLIKTMLTKGIADSRLRNVAALLPISENQIARAFRAIEELSGLHSALRHAEKGAVSGFNISAENIKQLKHTLSEWPKVCRELFPNEVKCYEQHGDFHARNIMVIPSIDNDRVDVHFIDGARFGVWPPYYDLTRLRLNLAVRVLDPSNTFLDQIPKRIKLWESVWNSRRPPSGTSLDKHFDRFAVMFDLVENAINATANRPGDGAFVSRLIAFNEFFDLVKMIAYVDLPPVRRLWLLVRLIDTEKRLRFIA
jgi:hypothetical protein